MKLNVQFQIVIFATGNCLMSTASNNVYNCFQCSHSLCVPCILNDAIRVAIFYACCHNSISEMFFLLIIL